MTEENTPQQPGLARKVLVVVLVGAAFAAAFYLGRRRHTHTLDNFARCLASKHVVMYGAFWCPHCRDQKEPFGSSFEYVPYVECGIKGSRAETPACLSVGIKRFPTWDFDGARVEGVMPLQALSEKTGCPLK